MKCDCKDWEENIEKVNAPRNPGTWNYDGKVFVFCPWCAKPLEEEIKPEN